MTTMKKIFQLFAALFVMVAVTGCYDNFETPQPKQPATDEDFAGMQRLTIQAVKDMFIAEHKTIDSTGSNTSWDDTKYTQIPEDAAYYIKGKVQSSDEEGNIYKSLYLVDETGAIEVKLSTGLYIDYPMGHFDPETGTIDTHYVYVKVSGLYIGNYRMMLSLGKGPTDSYNKANEHKFYANSNIEDPTEIAERVFLGEKTQLTVGEEILEIDASNYNSIYGKANEDKLGRMALIKGITCCYGDVDGNLFPSWMNTDVRPVESKYWYTWAVNENFFMEGVEDSPITEKDERLIHVNYYGSVLFSYIGLPTQTNKAGVFSVRTSGYSRFAKMPIVRDGAKGDILAIIGIYAKYWDQSYGAYQCSVNRYEDIMFPEDAYLSLEEVAELTPEDSRYTVNKTTDYDD